MELVAERWTHWPGHGRRIKRHYWRARILSGLRLRPRRHLHQDRGRAEKPVRDWLSFDKRGQRWQVAQTSRESESTKRNPAPERPLQAGVLRAYGRCRSDKQELTSERQCHENQYSV